MTQQSSGIFNWINTPNAIISSVVRVSIGIPFIFNSAPVYYKPPGRDLVLNVTFNKHTYVDGGVLDNFPNWVFKDSKTLGFRLLKPSIWEKYHSPENKTYSWESGMFSFLRTLLGAIIEKQESDFSNQGDSANTVVINTRDCNSLDFDMNEGGVNNLIKSGYSSTLNFAIENGYSFKNDRFAVIKKVRSTNDSNEMPQETLTSRTSVRCQTENRPEDKIKLGQLSSNNGIFRKSTSENVSTSGINEPEPPGFRKK